MARLPRIVIPAHPQYVPQPGNRRSRVFSEDEGYELYIDLLSAAAVKAQTEIWCHCLIPNHAALSLSRPTKTAYAIPLPRLLDRSRQ